MLLCFTQKQQAEAKVAADPKTVVRVTAFDVTDQTFFSPPSSSTSTAPEALGRHSSPLSGGASLKLTDGDVLVFPERVCIRAGAGEWDPNLLLATHLNLRASEFVALCADAQLCLF